MIQHTLMRAILLILTCILLSSSSQLVNGENYNLKIDEHSYEIKYFLEGNVIAMAIDQELTSLLIGTDNVEQDSIFKIIFPNELISAENNEFAVLVNGYEVDYEIINEDSSLKMTVFIPAFTEEIEIIGTKVIPEFPFGALFVLVSLTAVVILFSKSKLRLIK